MSSSYYDMDQNPELAGSLWTTGEDYMEFLRKLYYHEILPAEVCGWVFGCGLRGISLSISLFLHKHTHEHTPQVVKTMESDHTQSPNVSASKKSWGLGLAVVRHDTTRR